VWLNWVFGEETQAVAGVFWLSLSLLEVCEAWKTLKAG
jgi:hypothetical protein